MKKFLPLFTLSLAVILAYGNTLFHSFHFDDIPSILEKPWIRGLDKIPEFIFSYWQRPLVILSFNLNHAISEFEVWSYHVFNILFHLAATLLVYQLAQLIVRISPATLTVQSENKSSPIPFLAALLFALHPLNTQSVTYISSRSSVLATCFYLASLILFFNGVLKRKKAVSSVQSKKSKGVVYFFMAAVCFIFGVLSKQIIFSLPIVLFLFHFYFISSARFSRWCVEQLKWIVFAAVPLGGAIIYKQFWVRGFAAASTTPYSASEYFLTQTFVIPFEYLRKLMFPFNLNIDIDFPVISNGSVWTNWTGILALSAYTAACILVSRRRDVSFNRRLIGFGMAWILITLLPTSSVVPLLDLAVEHRTYLPMVGFVLLSAALIAGLWHRIQTRIQEHGNDGSWLKPIVPVCVLLMLVCYATGTLKRNTTWKDEISLWSDAKKKSPNLVRPYNNLGEAYDKLGEYDKAIPQFEAALQLNPHYFFALNNLGNIYGKKQEYAKAMHYFEKTLAEKPDYSPAHYNLARAQHLTGKPREAIESYRRAIRFNPYFEQAFYNLANLALQSGLVEESIQNFKQFLNMQPGHAKARFGLGNAYAMQGKFDLALAEFQQSAKLDPAFIFPAVNIANIHLQQGNIDAAIGTYDEILSRQPEIAGVHKNLGMIFYQVKPDLEKAAFHFQESLRLEPNQPQAPIIQSIVAELNLKKNTAN